jgi:hypothetical protein
MKINKVCKTCGSDKVLFDAYAEWNYQEQKFELHSEFDQAFCLDCDGETTIIDKEDD